MISNIDPIKSALVSLLSASVGSISKQLLAINFLFALPVDVAIQRCAWTVAILAGLVSAWNGLMTARERYRKNHINKNNEQKKH